MKTWVERSYPYLLGTVAVIVSAACRSMSVLDARQSSKILDNVLAISAVGLGFWSTSATLLLAVEHKALIRKLKKGPHFRFLVGYVFAAITWLAVLLTLTLLGIFFGDTIKITPYLARSFAGVWFGVLVVALTATFRAYYILSRVLKIAAADEES